MSSIAGIVSVAQTGLGVAQNVQDAQAAKLRGQFENQVDQRNAQLAEKQAEFAVNDATLDANRLGGQTAQQVASGRAAAAAGGADVNTGSAAAVTASRNLVGAVDALTIKNNAAREAWGYDVQAANYRTQGKLALMAGQNEATADTMKGVSTLLGGATDIYKIYKTRVPKTTPGNTTPLPAGRPAPDSPYGPSEEDG